MFSTDGVMPLAPSMDHVGPIGGCVRDLAIILQVIAGHDVHDPVCSIRAVPELMSTESSRRIVSMQSSTH